MFLVKPETDGFQSMFRQIRRENSDLVFQKGRLLLCHTPKKHHTSYLYSLIWHLTWLRTNQENSQ